MNKILSWIALVIAVAAIAVAVVGGNNQPQQLGGFTRFPNSDLYAKTINSNGAFTASGDGAVSGGTFNVTSSNTATSTIIAGCWQFYATSTLTPQFYQASTTPGIMVSQYGTCPNL